MYPSIIAALEAKQRQLETMKAALSLLVMENEACLEWERSKRASEMLYRSRSEYFRQKRKELGIEDNVTAVLLNASDNL